MENVRSCVLLLFPKPRRCPDEVWAAVIGQLLWGGGPASHYVLRSADYLSVGTRHIVNSFVVMNVVSLGETRKSEVF